MVNAMGLQAYFWKIHKDEVITLKRTTLRLSNLTEKDHDELEIAWFDRNEIINDWFFQLNQSKQYAEYDCGQPNKYGFMVEVNSDDINQLELQLNTDDNNVYYMPIREIEDLLIAIEKARESIKKGWKIYYISDG